MADSTPIALASTFLGSIAINTKGATYSDSYANSSLIVQSLNYIGVSQVRDSFTAYGKASPVLEAMADAGITFNFRVNYTLPATGEAGLASYLAQLKQFIAEHPAAVVSIEGINEADINSVTYAGLTGIAAAVAFQKDLYTAVKADADLSGLTVLNLSLGYNTTENYDAVGDLGAYSEAANAHSYTVTGKAADGQMETTLEMARNASTGDPVVITETGHTTLQSEAGIGTSETAQAKLLIDNLLLAFENGAQTTYIYELFDNSTSIVRGEKEVYFGIFNEDGTPKLAATALHNLTTILSFGDDGSATGDLMVNYTLGGTPANTHSMILEKSAGVYDLVLWTDTPVWNDIADVDIEPAPREVTVQLGKVEDVVRVYDPFSGLTPVAVYYNVSSFTVSLGDHALVIEVGADQAVHEIAPVVEPELNLAASELIARIDTLVISTGLEKITLTDSHVLAVSSTETMKYMIENYQDVLSKISGGYSFSVSYGETTWSKIQEFDAAGNLMLQTDYGLRNGLVVSRVVYHAAGQTEIDKYGITGKSYVSEHQMIDADGTVTLIERHHADGTYDYREIRSADGSSEIVTYDVRGRKLTDKVSAADGTVTELTYDATTGKVVSKIVREADGDVLTTFYTNDVKTVYGVNSHEGWKQHVTYDSRTGLIATDYTAYANGAAVNKIYTSGVLTKQNIRNADGSLDNWTYQLTGKTYASEHQKLDTAGSILLIERFHADGTYAYRDIRSVDGTREVVTYNAAGKVLTDVTVAKDATTTLTYDPATGHLVSRVVKEADGDVLTTLYTGGTKTVYGVTSHEGWKQHVTYDAKTGLIATDYTAYADGVAVNKIYTSGVLTKQNIRNADGSLDNWYYNITGKSYVSEHQATDKAGNVTLIERFHADGTYAYRDIRSADGTREVVTYNAAGKVLTDVTVAKDATTTLTYDPATGHLVSKVVKEADGDVLTTLYTGGTKTTEAVTSHEGWTRQTKYDATTGKILTEYTAYSDGRAVNKTYIDDILTKQNGKNADGSLDNWYYNITGKSYVSEYQTIDKTGKVTLIERLHADGTYDFRDIRFTDGSREVITYDAKGRQAVDTLTAADGTVKATTYDTATGKVFSVVVRETDGDTITTLYTGGVRTTQAVVSHEGWNQEIKYDATTGKIVSDYTVYADGRAVSKTYTDGVLTKQNGKNADGSLDNWYYNITGKTYVTEHQTTDRNGNVVLVERLHSDGTYDYRSVTGTDGSRDIETYNAAGKLITDVTIAANGMMETVTYDPATGKVVSEVIRETDGDVLTTLYTAGVKTTYTIVSHEGWNQQIKYDATTGVILSDYTAYGDGSAVSKTYASGVLSRQNIKHADASTENWAFNVTGKTYVTEHQTVDKSGVITLVERFHADGTYDYRDIRSTDGSREIINYDSKGDVLNDTLLYANGAKTVTVNLQDGTGDTRIESYDASGALTQRELIHQNGAHDSYAFADGQTMDGGLLNDTFYFRTTHDGTAVYEGGHDTVFNLVTGIGVTNHIAISDELAHTFSDLHMAQQGADVLISFDQDNSILLKATTVASLNADQFVFV